MLDMRAKSPLLLFILLVALNVGGQTSAVITFTNKFVTFTNLQGRLYKHVKVIRADLDGIIYLTDSGGGRVYFTNLAAKTLVEMGIPTNRISLGAERAEQEKTQRIQAAVQEQAEIAKERERFQNPSNWIELKIESVRPIPLSLYGGVRDCTVRTGNGSAFRAYVKLPEQVSSYYEQQEKLVQTVTKLKAQVTDVAARLKREEYQWKMVDAKTPTGAGGNPDYVDAVMAERARVNQWRVQLDAKEEQLTELQKQLEDDQKELVALNAAKDAQTSVSAFVSRNSYNGIPIVYCSASDRITAKAFK